jgi:hypothetical protein
MTRPYLADRLDAFCLLAGFAAIGFMIACAL